ncbi:cyclic diguanylate phosphodiesterase [Geotalea daltonii FRC-32]|uniref:Cyclic diguanylate phosphodiesterase n=2 Tax=Geotalea TaxID=2910589 RepID=B9M883_GEODF|nr:EAL domain-containing protein [Geotalea daltonii]ACM20349.1 cyclic diguanylate phosphodiesterase [Geotalea daltonii FRC-32]
MNNLQLKPLYLAPDQRRIPRLENSFSDCSYLFLKFKEHLKRSGHAAIVALKFVEPVHAKIGKSIALFIRTMDRKLSGRIEGGYKASEGEFFLLIVPDRDYRESDFQGDLATIRHELCRYFSLPHMSRNFSERRAEDLFTIYGVFLANNSGENADNTLFRAFQQLFSGSTSISPVHLHERQEIEDIISGGLITPVFQPIFSLGEGTVHGYEALSRVGRPSPFSDPELLFAKSAEHGLTFQLEMLCRRNALIRSKELGISERLFLNVCPSLLQANDHERGVTAALLEELGIERSNITFELTERTLIEDYGLFNRVLSYYREQGYSIAIDDLGSGYAGLKMLAQLEPEYVKLARFLVSDIDTSATRQALVEALVTFCGKIGAKVIAEGIERKEELDLLTQMGVSFGQGYLLARPSNAPVSCSSILHR